MKYNKSVINTIVMYSFEEVTKDAEFFYLVL